MAGHDTLRYRRAKKRGWLTEEQMEKRENIPREVLQAFSDGRELYIPSAPSDRRIRRYVIVQKSGIAFGEPVIDGTVRVSPKWWRAVRKCLSAQAPKVTRLHLGLVAALIALSDPDGENFMHVLESDFLESEPVTPRQIAAEYKRYNATSSSRPPSDG